MRMGMMRRSGGGGSSDGQSSFVSLFSCSAFLAAADGVYSNCCCCPALLTMLRLLLITALLRQEKLDGLASEINDDVIEKSFLSTAPWLSSWSSSNDVNGDVLSTPANVVEKITVARGTRAVLRCKVENIGAKTVVWRKEGEGNPLAIGLFPFAADARITADFSIRSNEWVLVIEDVRSDDEGIYFCQISTKVTHDTSQRTQLNVKSVSIEGLDYVEWGSRAQLVCSATGRPDPPQSVDWYKNGRRMRSDVDRGITITKNIDVKMVVSVLNIQNVRMSDAAEYTCQSSNAEHATVVLNVVRKTAAAEKMVSNNINCGGRAASTVCWTINSGLIYSLVIPIVVQMVRAAIHNTDSTTTTTS